MAAKIQIKRAYEPAEEEDGHRFLVDRLWPRGVKKETLHLTGWLKEIANKGWSTSKARPLPCYRR